MASWRSHIINWILKTALKPHLAKLELEHLAQSRKRWEEYANRQKLAVDCQVEKFDLNGIGAEWVRHRHASKDHVLLYLHGGAYVMGSPNTHRKLTARLSRVAHVSVLCIDYRLAPEHPCPAAIEDAVAAYRYLLDLGHQPERISLGGDSAGGGLTAATLLKIRDDGLPRPGAAILLSPWTDLTRQGGSRFFNADHDPMLPAGAEIKPIEVYLDGFPVDHPYASPSLGDWTGLPPIMIQVGSTEILLDDATRLAAQARMADVPVHLEVWDRLPHVFQMGGRLVPESAEAIRRLGAFLQYHLHSEVKSKPLERAVA